MRFDFTDNEVKVLAYYLRYVHKRSIVEDEHMKYFDRIRDMVNTQSKLIEEDDER